MSQKLGSPVQTEMAVDVFKNPLSGVDHVGSDWSESRLARRRRVFVQTETGCVLGMDLDRSDNAHTVKRRLQIALNFPIEDSSLTFGDKVLKNDLSAVRNDSPLLLTKNALHRSFSTPCLTPTGRDIQQRDQSGPIEILGHSTRFAKTKLLVNEIAEAVRRGIDPIPVHGGLGGAYYFRNVNSECLAIVKPTDEEPFAPNNPKGYVGKALGQPGLKRSVRVGETGYREVAAYLLDHDHSANVPPTVLVKITHPIFNVNDSMNGVMAQNKNLVSKIASLQQFIPHVSDASDFGTSRFPVSAVHRIGILDIRILNTDRHAGNILVGNLDGVGQFGHVELVPIDHGLCLPENLEDPYFEWINWPQASIPFSDEELEYISNLDPARDSDMLRAELPMIRDACLRVLFLCTVFLKKAASFGLCLAEIGEMMSRDFRCGEEEPSELELLCIEARKLVAEEMQPLNSGPEIDDFTFEIDCEDDGFNFKANPASSQGLVSESASSFASNCITGRSPLSKLDEIMEEEDNDTAEEKNFLFFGEIRTKIPTISKLSKSLKNTPLFGYKPNHRKFAISKPGRSHESCPSSSHRSANEPLPPSTSFVKLADMSEEEWNLFLEEFAKLLAPAFEKRQAAARLGHRQVQRLGTSCKF